VASFYVRRNIYSNATHVINYSQFSSVQKAVGATAHPFVR
jgi:hypothetical protein